MGSKRHNIRSNILPKVFMVGPITLWLGFLIVIPLLYVLVMSFCGTDEYYNIVYKFTLENYKRLFAFNYLEIYAQSLLIAFFTTVTR